MLKAWRYDPEPPENRSDHAVSAETRLTNALYCLGLLAFLAVMAHDTHEMVGALR